MVLGQKVRKAEGWCRHLHEPMLAGHGWLQQAANQGSTLMEGLRLHDNASGRRQGRVLFQSVNMVHFELSTAYRGLGRLCEALALLRRALALVPAGSWWTLSSWGLPVHSCSEHSMLRAT